MEAKLLIGNQDVAATRGRVFDVRNPITQSNVSVAAAASPEDAAKAAAAAQQAFPSWAELSPNARRKVLQQCADAIEKHEQEFICAMTEETGSARSWGAFNVRLGALMLREAAAMTTQITGEVIPSDHAGCLAFSVREPVGVILGIAPWNAPVILGVRAMALPLACGNTVVLKSSELCPYTHYLLGVAFRDAGLPAGVVNILSNAAAEASDIVSSLIEHPAVRRINFTGSTRVGRIVAELAGKYLKPIVLELGGKAPLIVLDDAELDEAVCAAAFGGFMHQGQICMSTERIVIFESVANDFAKKLADKADSLKAGDPRESTTQIGSLINAEAGVRVEQLIEDARTRGAKVLAGGTHQGTIFRPTVLDGVTPEMKIYHEESFGPVVAITRVKSDEEAVHVANDTAYGLTAAVFSANIPRALAVARRIQTGMCHINGATVHDEAQMPFGGTKASGYGRFGGKAGLDEFTELRWITINTKASHYPI